MSRNRASAATASAKRRDRNRFRVSLATLDLAAPAPLSRQVYSFDGTPPPAVPSDRPPLPPSHKIRYQDAIRGPDAAHWEQGAVDEWTRLASTTSTIVFISHHDKPAHRLASYYNPQLRLKVRESGEVVHRVRGTYGGNRTDYTGPTSADTADMSTVKLLLQAAISEDAHWMTIDIVDFYLGTPMERPEYMRAHISQIPAATMATYNLLPLVHNDHVMIKVVKGLYGLPHAGRIAQQRLHSHLAAHGYHQCAHTPCLYHHSTNSIFFSLVVDDFGVKFHNKADVDHLITTLQLLYPLRISWTGSKYLGFDIAFDRPHRHVTLSMDTYIAKASARFAVPPNAGTDNPCAYIVPAYGRSVQFPHRDQTAPLPPPALTRLQQILGTLLFYGRAVDATILVRISKLSSHQSHATAADLSAAETVLAYLARYPSASIRLHACDMRLIVHSDASFNSETGARSRTGALFYLGDYDDDTKVNGPVLCLVAILHLVVASAAEAEYGGLFAAGQTATSLRHSLQDLGYPQPTTLIISDNTCASNTASDAITARFSKAFDMRLHWIRDRVRLKEFRVEWRPGHLNLADFLTKDHPTKHFLSMRKYFVHCPSWSPPSCSDLDNHYRPFFQLPSSPAKELAPNLPPPDNCGTVGKGPGN